MNKKMMVVSGQRKNAVAKVRIQDGTGKIFYNILPYEQLGMFHKLALDEPIKICEQTLGKFPFDIAIKTSGGGKESQVEAARLGIAKALVQFTGSIELKKAFLLYDRNLLVADTRRKEAYKPGDSKARSKRQTSYR
ncbi:30S ribosomal protein S9 [Candidatus Pacearchaeota archaeon CG10_big_fil_rev_8_21_14_0_10_34_76]|nr:MAG: 30S ribosomal protein S9 [Candidatus Pacearchaeota archaeon CG10_big_fil_rev_8_21_14_0_10_34_76]